MNCTAQIVECRLDWLTVTATDPDKAEGLYNLGLQLVRKQAVQGGEERVWRWKGYDGYHANGMTVGKREDSTIVQASGLDADQYFDALWLTADHCTRIDLCVTARYAEEDNGVSKRANDQAHEWRKSHPTSAKPVLIYDDDRPSTLYLGSRLSDLYARLYNKHLESGRPDYERCWRWEVEVKGEPAQRTAAWLHSAGNRPDRIRSAVYQHFSRRGCRPDFSGLDDTVRLQSIRTPSDVHSRLAWLERDVRPAILRLLSEGYADAVWEALGIPRSLSERYRLRWLIEHGGHRNELYEEEEHGDG